MRIAIVFLLCCGLTSAAQNGLDPSKWYAVDNIRERPADGNWCYAYSQASAGAGLLTLKAVQGSFPCQGGTAAFKTGAIMSSPFFFTYGTVTWVAKLSPSGVHTTLWLWGGANGTSGYPPTCIAALKNGGNVMASCTADASNAYEIDMAEMLPASNGVNTIGNYTHLWVNAVDSGSTSNTYNAGVDLTQAFHTYQLVCTTTPQIIFKLDGVTTTTLSDTHGMCAAPKFLIFDQETDSTAGSGVFPITAQAQSVQVVDANNNVLFSDFFPGSPGFWFGIP